MYDDLKEIEFPIISYHLVNGDNFVYIIFLYKNQNNTCNWVNVQIDIAMSIIKILEKGCKPKLIFKRKKDTLICKNKMELVEIHIPEDYMFK